MDISIFYSRIWLVFQLNFAIESLQLAEVIPIPFFSKIRAHSTNNVLVFNEDGDYYATLDEGLVEKVFDRKPTEW